MKNNKGFSLVEMLVAFAIAAIAGLAVYGLMSAGTNNFRRTGTDVGLQYEQQVVVNKLRDALVETTNALSYDDSTKTLLVYNQEDMGLAAPGSLAHTYRYVVTKIFLDKDASAESGVLYQVSKPFDTIDDVDVTDINDDDASILGEEVSDITFDISKVDKGTLSFTISFINNEKTLSSTQTVALRNEIVVDDNADEIFATSTMEQNSFIDHIEIYRNGVNVTGGSCELALANSYETMSFPFTYKVVANEDSEREYAAYWKIAGGDTTGVTVEPTGMVKVTVGEVTNGQTFQLYAISVDDADKYAIVNLTIVTGGVYPKTLALSDGSDYTDYAGYRDYKIFPKITFTDNTTSTDGTLCTWVLSGDALPEGCEFDPANNSLIVTDKANGLKVTFKATTKNPNAEGEKLTAEMTLVIDGVPRYVPKQQLILAGVDSIYNNRGTYTTVLASWTNSTTSNFTYHWTIEPTGENWDDTNKLTTKSFNKNITYRSNNNGFTVSGNECTSDRQHSFVDIMCNIDLDWKNAYTIKVTCYATDYNGNKYGIGSEVDKNYQGPVELDVTYEPVKCVLKPISTYRQNKDQSYSFISDRTLKRSVRDKKENVIIEGKDVQRYKASKKYGGKTVRQFEIALRGVLSDSSNNVNAVEVIPTQYLFYSKDGGPGTNNDLHVINVYNSNLRGQINECGGSNTVTGFFIDMNSNNFESSFANSSYGIIKYASVRFTAQSVSNENNKVEAYYLSSENGDYYSDDDLELSSNVRFPIMYDKEQSRLNKDYLEFVQ